MPKVVEKLNLPEDLRTRWWFFAGWVVLSSLCFYSPLFSLLRLCSLDGDLSYLIVVPFFTAGLLVYERDRINCRVGNERGLGYILVVLAGLLALLTRFAGSHWSKDIRLSAYILSLVLFWASGFALSFGRRAFRASLFALLFLLLTVPPPNFLLDRVIYLLQAGSASITEFLFNLLGVPMLREGFVFHLTKVTIEIAKECSGIRSSMALLILALLTVHFALTKFWKQALFVAVGLFMTILKNGIRIVALTLLAIYVNPSFLTGRLHHQGGVVFFLIGLLLLAPVWWLLRRGEAHPGPETSDSGALGQERAAR